MAFDGITIACITKELQERLIGGRIYKIAQPEADELLITVRNGSAQHRLFLSANASLPLIYLVEENKPSPMTSNCAFSALRESIKAISRRTESRANTCATVQSVSPDRVSTII